ncbi:hypothetical protein Tco_0416176, partial [Tanacetum coccineum]
MTPHQSGGNTSYKTERWRVYGRLYLKVQGREPGRGRGTGMHEDLWIHAWNNSPRADQALVREKSKIGGR